MNCPSCTSLRLRPFYNCPSVPVHSTLLMRSRSEALGYSRRSIDLVVCLDCGFISNRAFERGLHEYSDSCEESQGYSEVFSQWLEGVVQRLVQTYDIRGKTVLEIGSGKGEFLWSVCQQGNNRGVGYDPAYVPGRLDHGQSETIEFRKEMWGQGNGVHSADVIACRHTLEHIPDVLGFLTEVRQAIGQRTDSLLFIEVPDTFRVLKEGAFWDIYYEHCSYFTRHTLQDLVQRAGFEVLEHWLDYHDQYLMLVARPLSLPAVVSPQAPSDEEFAAIDQYIEANAQTRAYWTDLLQQAQTRGDTVMLWGGGSKATAFLNVFDTTSAIEAVIDINPNKHKCFIPGSGQQVHGPEILTGQPAQIIIAMNPAYRAEIQATLDAIGSHARLYCL